MRSLAAAVLASTLAAAPAAAKDDCHVEIGPHDRVSRGETLVVRSGERVENALALQGDLVIEGGAVAEKAVAVGGSVTVKPGGQVREDAVAIGGDVRIGADGRVGKDAVSLGGQVRQAEGARVGGSVLGIAVQAGKGSLAREILGKLGDLEGCEVVEKRATGG
jgi:NDP-sugar pyrophosphorylase family protein